MMDLNLNYKLYWFTGQPGAGKTSLAHLLKSHLEFSQPEKKVVILDGDNIRDIFKNQDYSKEGRLKNVDLVQSCCRFLIENDIVVIVCMVSPFKKQRSSFCKEMNGKEVYVVCHEERGREHYFVEYFEMPTKKSIAESQAIVIDTTKQTPIQSFINLLKKLVNEPLP
jgi:adenylate kinase family enzyme